MRRGGSGVEDERRCTRASDDGGNGGERNMWQREKTIKWMRREQNVTRTRNSKDLDTRNQQLNTRCNENSTKQILSDEAKKAKSVWDKDELINIFLYGFFGVL